MEWILVWSEDGRLIGTLSCPNSDMVSVLFLYGGTRGVDYRWLVDSAGSVVGEL